MNWENVIESLEHLAGFVIVMLALSVLWGLTALMGRIVARLPSAPARPIEPALPLAPSAPAAVAADSGLSEEEVVVIAATVAAMVDGRHRVVSVRPIHSSWGQQGRREIHASHRIR